MQSPMLDPFEVGELIGQGGMGRVFRATHRLTGIDAAIKVIGDTDRQESTKRFHREVQAHAGLVHPRIVYLFDYGVVDETAAAASDDRLVAGAPYVAMELADRGTVRDTMPIDDWSTTRSILLQTLDALAFAHARDVIHRDLKPENLLRFDAADATPQIKVADLGIAHAFDDAHRRDDETLQTASGTPLYMPPEQLRGRWRDYGPWTDLYALGCVAWELVCGQPPFRAETAVAIAIQHCTDDRPPLEARFAVPDGLQDWIHQAMAIDPANRFRRAADAAAALPPAVDPARSSPSNIADVPREPSTAATTDGDSLTATIPLSTLEVTTISSADTLASSDFEPTSPRFEDGHRSPSSPPALEVPTDWRRTEEATPPTPLIGTGTGLFDLRPAPFVDRNHERNLLWDDLRHAAEDRSFRLAVIAGPSGTGKSRLVEWIAERAHEVGAATILRAVHTRGGTGPIEGLPGLIRRTFQAWRLPRPQLYERLLERLPQRDNESEQDRRTDARALTELVEPTDDTVDPDGPHYQFDNQNQKWRLVARLLRRLARDRAPLVWLDDLQWSPELIDFVEYLVDLDQDRPPALVLATVRSDVLAERPELAEQLAGLTDHDDSHRLELTELPPDDHRRFVHRLLPLESRLGERIAERTEGNPLFAHHLLGDLITGDSLEIGDDGFRLREGEQLSLPDDIHQLWTSRIDRLLDALPEARRSDAAEAIELAATLGREIDETEWHAACADADLEPPPQLVDDLVEHGLAEHTPEGWTFVHELLINSLARRTRDAGRWRDHHRVCAAMLERIYDEHPLRTARRRADHWLEADESRRALSPLLDEGTRLKHLGFSTARKRILERRAELIDELQLSPTARPRLENELDLANANYTLGNLEGIIETINETLRRCLEAGELDLASRCHQALAVCKQHKPDVATAIEHLEKAIEFARRSDADILLGKALIALGWQLRRIPDYDRASRCAKTSAELFTATAHRYLRFHARLLDAVVHIDRGDFEVAKSILEPTMEEAAEVGLGPLEAETANALADIARLRGRAEQGRRMCRQALDVLHQPDQNLEYVRVLSNLARIELMDRNIDTAHQLVTRIESLYEQMGFPDFPSSHHGLAIGLAAGEGDWKRFDELLDSFVETWSQQGHRDRDTEWLLQLSAEFADDDGHDDRVRRLRRLVDHHRDQSTDGDPADDR